MEFFLKLKLNYLSKMHGRRVAWSFFQVRTRTYDLETEVN